MTTTMGVCEITPQGWEWIRRPSYPMFTRYTQMSQVDPVKTTPDDDPEFLMYNSKWKQLDDSVPLNDIVTLFIPEFLMQC